MWHNGKQYTLLSISDQSRGDGKNPEILNIQQSQTERGMTKIHVECRIPRGRRMMISLGQCREQSIFDIRIHDPTDRSVALHYGAMGQWLRDMDFLRVCPMRKEGWKSFTNVFLPVSKYGYHPVLSVEGEKDAREREFVDIQLEWTEMSFYHGKFVDDSSSHRLGLMVERQMGSRYGIAVPYFPHENDPIREYFQKEE
jgi:hypothetical protein